MKYTVLFLKYTAVVLLVLIMVATFVVAGILALVSIVGTLMEKAAEYLLIIPIALLVAFLGFITLDCLQYLIDKWEI